MSNLWVNIEVWVLGLLGLNIIVFVHELGHFLVARAVGINVEVFSLGMGPKLWKKQFKSFEFAISLLPLGGYCKMQSESMDNEQITQVKAGDMYYGHPWRRFLTVAAGALFNFVFAYMLFVIVSMMSSQRLAISPQIVEASGFNVPLEPLANGDTILAINGQAIDSFAELQQWIFTSAGKTLTFKVKRAQTVVEVDKFIEIDKKSGVGFLPVAAYVPPVIQRLVEGYPAQQAGLAVGDTITSVNGNAVAHMYALIELLSSLPQDAVVTVEFLQASSGTIMEQTMQLEAGKLGIDTSVFEQVTGLSFWQAIPHGAKVFTTTLSNYWHALGLLFSGKVDFQESTSGPIQNTAIIGQVARESLRSNIADILMLLAIFSLIIGFMNWLPIPILDGGLMVLFIIEMLRGGKPLGRNFLRIYQFIGIAFLILLTLLAIQSDIGFLF